MRNPIITQGLLATFCISLLFLGGCDPNSLNGRNLRGQGARNITNLRQFNQDLLTTNAHYVGYLAYNTTSSVAGGGPAGPAGVNQTVSPLNNTGNNGNVVNGNNGQGDVVNRMGGGQNHGAPCMVRAIAVNKSRDGFIWNANASRTIQNVRCSPDSQITATSNGFFISAGSQLNHSTYLPMTTYGAAVSPVLIPTGPITKIDGDISGYIVARYAEGSKKEHVVLIMYELGRNQNRPTASRVDELEFHNHQIKDLAIDHNTGQVQIAATTGGIGKLLQFDLNAHSGYEGVSNALMRQAANMPYGTQVNPGYIDGYQNPGYSERAYYLASAPRAIANFDGLTAVLDHHGAFIVEELYGEDVNNVFTTPNNQTMTLPDDFIGARATYLKTANFHTANPNIQSRAFRNYQDIAVGNNVFYLLSPNGRIFTFYNDTTYSPSGNNGLSLNMKADTINLDNNAHLMAVSGPDAIRIFSTNAYGDNVIPISQGNTGAENYFREGSGRIIDNAIFVNRVEVGTQALPEEIIDNAEENEEE